jgi:hypothetical protein
MNHSTDSVLHRRRQNRQRFFLSGLLIAFVGLFLFSSTLRADTDSSTTTSNGATLSHIRAVRLSYVEGSVQMLRGDHVEFTQAEINMPVVEGSRINTGADGKAEIEFEDGSVVRLTANSSLNIDTLESASDGTLLTQVSQLGGLVYYELRHDSKAPYTVLYGNRKVTLEANSTFRVNLASNPAGMAVLDGTVQVTGGTEYEALVREGQTIQFDPAGGEPYTIADVVTPNGWDKWNDAMDEQAANAAEHQTAAREENGGGGMGWSALDNYGGWYPVPGYGDVWQPYDVGADFDPYGYGSWGYMSGLGYSWISGYPWGWLPYHYGGWAFIDGFGWGWMPGFGGFGYGGGYGFGGFGGFYPYSPVYNGPTGYKGARPPVRGTMPPHRLIAVGHPPAKGTALRAGMARPGAAGFMPQPINYHGTLIEPLHSIMDGVKVPVRNAALYNDHPATAFHGDIAGTLEGRQEGTLRGPVALRAYDVGRPAGASQTLRGSYNPFSGGAHFGSHGASSGYSFHGTAQSSSAGTFHGGGFSAASHASGGGGFSGGGAHAGGGGGGGGAHH